VAVVGGGNSTGQAAIWPARGGALVTLLHRRADLRETMSSYLIADLDRFGVEVRDRSEIAELHGEHGHLDGVTLEDGTRLPVNFAFTFLGATPCTDWLDDTVARDENGFIVTGDDVAQKRIPDTSVPGGFAIGDVRSGSIKRCAAAVGEGAMVVRFMHERMHQPCRRDGHVAVCIAVAAVTRGISRSSASCSVHRPSQAVTAPPSRWKPPVTHSTMRRPYSSDACSHAKWPASSGRISLLGSRSARYSLLDHGTKSSSRPAMIWAGVVIVGNRPRSTGFCSG
jgi:Pyridine nucleotide-disulphide oxidoreductase